MRSLRPAAVLVSIAVALAVPGVAQADDIRDGQWHLTSLDLPAAHEISTGDGIVVGLIDSGVDAQHPDLVSAVTAGKALSGSFDPLTDSTGTGTAVASILAGRGHGEAGADGVLGVAPGATVMSVSVADTAIGGGQYIAEAVKFLTDSGVDVIALTAKHSFNEPTQDGIRAAAQASIPVVVPAGSVEGGNYSEVVTAIAVDAQEQHLEGTTPAAGAQYSVAAPAQDIPAAAPGEQYASVSGTAAAAAIIAGTLALIKSSQPGLAGPALIQYLLSEGTKPVPPGQEELLGQGLVDPLAALSTGGGPENPGSTDEEATDGALSAGASGGSPDPLLIAGIALAGLLSQVALVGYARLAGRRKVA
ncbi:subtilase family protein [Stackebrandtia endophytica]|uniref:Subtilase family protein n=1 Tax=Stackebrandtia endophytica TaxID=1496996 RepID=A0A543B0P3_9ACTN|nr:S8 family serine peptidase [Stackebrandtia endophytica]TQL78356.1 subtilase family protein [Stackebrandtia endophytica]